MARHLARADRDALHGVLRDDLGHCGYVAVAIESGDYASARTVANRAQVEFRLLSCPVISRTVARPPGALESKLYSVHLVLRWIA